MPCSYNQVCYTVFTAAILPRQPENDLSYLQHSDACHLWMLALMDCAAEGRVSLLEAHLRANPRHGRWEICECCEGRGTRDNPAFSNGITSSEWQDEWDADEREDYLNGRYDVACSDCGGSGKVLVPIKGVLPWAVLRSIAEERREATGRAEAARDQAAEMLHMGYC